MKFKINKGFTMIETLVAITILMISIAGPLTVAHKGLTAALYSREQMTASYLAQDAIEYIKNVRDSNLVRATGSWDASFETCDETSKCIVNTLSGVPTANIFMTKTSSNEILHLGADGYGHYNTSDPETSFKRSFYVIPGTPAGGVPIKPDESTLVVTVNWTTNGVPNSVVISTGLYNTLR